MFSEKLDGFIVALHSDPSIERPEKSRPYMTLREREIMVKAIKYVWYVEAYNTEEDLLQLLACLLCSRQLLQEVFAQWIETTTV